MTILTSCDINGSFLIMTSWSGWLILHWTFFSIHREVKLRLYEKRKSWGYMRIEKHNREEELQWGLTSFTLGRPLISEGVLFYSSFLWYSVELSAYVGTNVFVKNHATFNGCRDNIHFGLQGFEPTTSWYRCQTFNHYDTYTM